MAKYDAMFDPRKHNRPGTYAKRVVVFQRGKDLIVRKYVKPRDPRTRDQIAYRQKLGKMSKKLAQAWTQLSAEEKDRCRRLALKGGLATGYMAFTQIWWKKRGQPGRIVVRGPGVGKQLNLKIAKRRISK